MTIPKAFVSLVLLAAAVTTAGVALRQRMRGITRTETPPAGARGEPRPAPGSPAPASARMITLGETVREGLSIALRVGHLDPAMASSTSFREGDDVAIGLLLRDATSGLPITNAILAAWLVDDDNPDAPDDPRKTARLVRALLEANFLTQAKVDLNVYYVLTLNEDTISVVDPLYGFGGMKLLALVPLGGRGHDWVLAREQERLFVSLPEAAVVVAIDTRRWEVLARVPTPPHPTRLGLQPDGRLVWVACEGGGKNGELPAVAGIDVQMLSVAARGELAAGPHDMAFSDDSRHLIITNAGADSVTILETADPASASSVRTGPRPVSVAYSRLGRQAWVAHAGDGRIVTVDPGRRRVVSSVQNEPGLEHLQFTPDGRRALAVNPRAGALLVFDAANLQLLQRGPVDGEPDRIAFSDTLAYVRRRKSPMLRLVPLEGLGIAGRPIAGNDVPMGAGPLGVLEFPTPAASIVPAPDGMLVGNAADRSVHFYKEGMSAPMGSFRIRNGKPRAVFAVDRSLRERREPGFYETTIKLPEPDDYKVVFSLRTPRIVHSFRFRTDADPALARVRNVGQVDITFSVPAQPVRAGESVPVRFRVTDRTTAAPRTGLADVRVQLVLAPGTQFDWYIAEPEPDGWYSLKVRPPKEGAYYLFFACASIGLDAHGAQGRVIHVEPPETH